MVNIFHYYSSFSALFNYKMFFTRIKRQFLLNSWVVKYKYKPSILGKHTKKEKKNNMHFNDNLFDNI